MAVAVEKMTKEEEEEWWVHEVEKQSFVFIVGQKFPWSPSSICLAGSNSRSYKLTHSLVFLNH